MANGKKGVRVPSNRGVKVCVFDGFGNASQFGIGQAMSNVTAARGEFMPIKRGRPRKKR